LNDSLNQNLPRKKWWERVVAIVLIIIIIVFTGFAISYLKKSVKKPVRRPPQKITAFVETIPLKKEDVDLKIEGLGIVKAASEVSIKTEIPGKIVYLNERVYPGGHIKEGELIAKIDDREYKIEVARAEAAYNKAVADLRLEEGSQEVAKKEYELASKLNLIDNTSFVNLELALKKPQLLKAKADVSLALEELNLAKLRLTKTGIYAPYDILVLNKAASVGDFLSTNSEILTGVDLNEVWVEVKVPYENLKYLDIPNQYKKDVTVHILTDSNFEYKGKFLKVIPQVEETGLMAKILVSIENPFEYIESPVLVNSKVKAIFIGKTLRDIYKINLSFIRNEKDIYVVDEDKLLIKEITPIYVDNNYAYIKENIKENELLITTNIPNAVTGMPIKILNGSKK